VLNIEFDKNKLPEILLERNSKAYSEKVHKKVHELVNSLLLGG